ncbi:hypothetical protein [Flavobacterium subsaxonicum]|uniref:Lipoprotein n=1 Tax=Flavobacterium subsaxonicum WB 4.1-42 = DSM 21790 TaxID=1121898 RepID=A0A0A2MJ43_9FLAO|nr:hypothetical protein [Flavobacterium subsaxonicum]KGO92314.1 hypothetical protein Q766_12645 [Flavobacterium subsaxonicum WB 4.1-42 = DSM 21790]
MKKIALLLLTFSALYSCSSPVVETDEKIDAKLRNTLKTKTDSVFEAVTTSNQKIYKAVASDDFFKHLQASIRNVVMPFRNGFFKPEFTVYKQYHVTTTRGEKIDIPSDKEGFTFSYVPDQTETYVSLLKVSSHQFDYLIALIYGNDNNQWKLYQMDLMFLGNFNQTVQNMYDTAKKKEADGYLLDAYVFASAANDCVREEHQNLSWNNKAAIEDYYKALDEQVNETYKFPIALNSIISKPTLLEIKAQVIYPETVPAIFYHTSISKEDTIALKRENVAIRAEVRKIFKGLNFNKSMVYRGRENLDGSGVVYDYIDKKEK